MASTYTTNTKLAKPAYNDASWNTTLNTDFDAIDALAPVGGLAVTLTETPSASLHVDIAAGTFRKSDGSFVTYAGTTSYSVTTAATNYLYLSDTGTLTASTSSFPASTLHVRLAVVVAGATTITSVTDARVAFHSTGTTVSLALAGGTFADSGGVVTVETGTTNGVKFGGGVTSKIGFWGTAPGVQPASANQAALGSLVTVTLTDSSGGSATTTIADVGASFSQSGLNNIHASLIAQINHAVTDFASVKTLVNQMRSDLVARGILKGSA